MSVTDDVRRLESERLRPSRELNPADETWRRLLDLIAAECRRAGYLPSRHADTATAA